MKIRFLLLGTSLSLAPQTISAQCISPVQDCYALGYTQTSCPNGKGVKCPFGNGWYCGGTAAQDCIKLGYNKDCTGAGESGSGQTCNGKYQSCTCDSSYKYACSGTGYAGGSGSACGGKYTSCTCTSGYEWKDSSCQQKISDGAYGELYYCNGKVVGVRATGMNFYVAIKDLKSSNYSGANSQCQNYSFCGNVNGTLPTKDQLLSIYTNKSAVNTLLSVNGGTNMTERAYWSSTNGNNKGHYIVYISSGIFEDSYDFASNYVRPILDSW